MGVSVLRGIVPEGGRPAATATQCPRKEESKCATPSAYDREINAGRVYEQPVASASGVWIGEARRASWRPAKSPLLRCCLCSLQAPGERKGAERRRLLKDSFPRKQMAPLMRLPKKWPQCPRQTKESTENAFTVAPRRISVTDIRSPFFGAAPWFFGECRGNTERLRAEVIARSEMWASCAAGIGEVALKIYGSYDTVDLSRVAPQTKKGKMRYVSGAIKLRLSFDSYDSVLFTYVSVRLV